MLGCGCRPPRAHPHSRATAARRTRGTRWRCSCGTPRCRAGCGSRGLARAPLWRAQAPQAPSVARSRSCTPAACESAGRRGHRSLVPGNSGRQVHRWSAATARDCAPVHVMWDTAIVMRDREGCAEHGRYVGQRGVQPAGSAVRAPAPAAFDTAAQGGATRAQEGQDERRLQRAAQQRRRSRPLRRGVLAGVPQLPPGCY